ncbi:uncharacterized protein DEA37_0009406 [Paragonimus westermani]|uniref:PKD domain-containing protein n=1 Tax=Paragonimus westermani TaxID=34504 RepID=A0A5J4P443_9TREM|nr:uncharacterized protein DEA37_0009406 [Paragonimus westermani]
MDVQDCVSPTLTGCENQLRRLKLDVSSTVEPYDYEVVEVVNVNMTTVGWQRVPFSGSPWSIQPGDRLGLLVTKPIPIACALPSTYQPNDLITTTITSVTVGYTIDHSRLSRSGVRFQLGSWTKIVHKTVLSGTISQIGDAMILLSLSTFENGLNEVVANQTISIVSALSTDGLEKTELKTNVATTLRLTNVGGLTTESNSVSIGPAQPLVFNFLHGSNLTVDLKVDGQFKTVQIDYVHRKIISEALSVSAPVEMPYVVNVSNTLGWQEISGTVRFDEPMEGLSVTFEPPVSTVNADVKFNVAFRRGTSIELQIDFNDTNVYNEPVNKLQNWPQGYQKTHRYAKAGTYVVKLSASGGSKQDVVQVTVSVQGPLGTYILEPANSYTGRNDLFALLVNRVAGDIAVMTQIGIDWGDTLAPFSDRFIEGKKIGHVYTSTGDFTITVTLTMNTSVKKYTTLVSVREPIRNFGCSLLTNPIKFGDKVSVAVSVRDGEQVTITAQFEVGQPAQILQQNIAEPVVLDYTYLTTGQHNISIKAANVVGTKTCLLNADVRKPISNMYFEFPPLLENYAGETSVLIRYMGTTVDFPAGLSYVVDWGDSSPLEVGSLDKPFVKHKIEHVLTRLSYFQVSARLDNQVSRYETTSKVGVFGRIGYIRLQITVAATGEIGYGEKHDRFAAGNPLKLMILSDGRPDNVAETLFEILDLTSGKNTSLTWAESNYQLFTFTKQGQMRIFAEGRNPFSHAFTSMDIYIGSDLRGLRGELVNASVLSPQKTGLFRVFFEAISESSCICVEKEDQTGPIVFPAKDQHAKDCISCPTFNSVYKRPINNTLDIQLNYPTSGEKQLKITAQNPSAQIMRSFTVTVSQLECDPPQIWFIEDSIKSPSSPLTVESNKPVTVGANITGNICTLNGQNTIRWSVFELDVDTLNPIRQVNVSDQPSARSSELLLPANHLKPGFYIATIRVNLSVAPGAPTVSSQADAYIYSVYPPLMIQLYEGNPESVDVGLAQETICLNPQKYSYDPAITDKSEPQSAVMNLFLLLQKYTPVMCFPFVLNRRFLHTDFEGEETVLYSRQRSYWYQRQTFNMDTLCISSDFQKHVFKNYSGCSLLFFNKCHDNKIDPPKPEEIENILNSLLDQNSSRMNTLQLTGNLNTKANIVANYAEIVLQQNSLDKARKLNHKVKQLLSETSTQL